jgi:primosomal protein N' (replication factor Y)
MTRTYPAADDHPGDGGADLWAPDLRTVKVLLPLPLAGAYDYRVDDEDVPPPGSFVEVPLGPRRAIGVVWDSAARGGPTIEPAKLKPVGRRLPAPPMDPALRRLIDWVAAYTLNPPGAILRMAMSAPDALVPAPPRIAYARATDDLRALGLKPTDARRRVLEVLADGPPRAIGDIAQEAGCTDGVVRELVRRGALQPVELPASRPFARPDPDRAVTTLSPDQAAAAAALVSRAESACFSVTVLDGVTGAGKTEVYLEAVAAALRVGRQALVLLPEIALSSDWLERFRRRFGVAPAAWHSELSSAERRHAWRAAAEGEARVVVGARSALFLPLPELGVIVVDEEHDGAFKQEDGPIYHARDMAVVRARLENRPIILASATPSLETVVNVERGRYALVHLPDRFGGARLPSVQAIDMRRDPPPPGRWISPALAHAVTETLEAGEQALLFLNRRGYAPLTLCRRCGHRMACPSCSAWLVEHRLVGRLQCHHCGHTARLPPACPNCGAAESFFPCGPGVERLAEEVMQRFPDARLSILASDTIGGPKAAAELFRSIRDGEVDVIVGTQVVAKGHHFPNLTLVGVIDADLGLAGGDLRAAERTYQMLHQVSGRAGRADRPGRVLLQTHDPSLPVMRALMSGDRDAFMQIESDTRRTHGMPPFGRLAALIVSGPDAESADALARALGRAAPQQDGVSVLGPAPAPLAILRGRHRRRLLLKARRDVDVQDVLRAWLVRVKPTGSLRIQVDVDPYSFL